MTKNLNKLHQKLFYYGLYLSYLLFFIAFTGIVSISPEYLTTLDKILKYYIASFLIIRFNPLIPIGGNTQADLVFDKKVAFLAGIFMLLTLSATDLAMKNLNINTALEEIKKFKK